MKRVHKYILLLLSIWISGGASPAPPTFAILKDAVSWMTFRKNGVLMTTTDLDFMFIQPIQEMYASSKIFRALAIAFNQGVMPRLTLQENEACDPAYTLEYRDPYRNILTYHHQKKFTFKCYEDRNKGGLPQFCDYRQGLVCKSHSKKCECREGSSMQPISPGSPTKRCLLHEGEVCSLIDLDHGTDPNHSLLASHLHHMIFSLEKPIGCQDGTQCRFKDTSKLHPKCYANTDTPWYTPSGPQRDQSDRNGHRPMYGIYDSSCKIDPDLTQLPVCHDLSAGEIPKAWSGFIGMLTFWAIFVF